MTIDFRIIGFVALGAAIGGVLRYLISFGVVERWGLPSGPVATLLINVTGSFAIGLVLEYARTRTNIPLFWRPFLATGILGGYTTFSTFSFEAFSMLERGALLQATIYVGGSVLLGVLAAFAGITAIRVAAA